MSVEGPVGSAAKLLDVYMSTLDFKEYLKSIGDDMIYRRMLYIRGYTGQLAGIAIIRTID